MSLLHKVPLLLLTACLLTLGVFSVIGPAIAQADYDITNFGAIANDGIDDSSAIAAAIAAASSAGDRVIIPAGTFSITEDIKPDSGTILIGAGRDLSTVEYIGSSTKDLAMVRMSGRSDVEIANMTFDAKLSSAVNTGISASNSSGINIYGNRVKDLGQIPGFGPHGIFFNDWANNGTTGGVTDSIISNNEILNIGNNTPWGSSIRLTASSRNVIDGNTINGAGRGGILTNQSVFGNGPSSELTITNNLIRNMDQGGAGAGISIELFPGGGNTLIENNDVDHWISIIGSDRVAVRGNKIQDPDGSLGPYGLEAYGSNSVVFADNQIDAGQHVGILTGGHASHPGGNTENLYLRNTFENMESYAALLGGGPASGAVFPANRIYLRENEFVGLPNNGIENPDGEGAGIRFSKTILNVVLDSNIIRDFDGNALEFGGQLEAGFDYLEVINNVITGNGAASNAGTFPGANAYVDGNTVTGNGNNNLFASKGSFDGNARPEVEIVAPASALVGEEVSFSFTWVDDGTVDGILWDLGEGLPEITATVTRTFFNEGTFDISLVVWDDGGRGVFAELQITIVRTTSHDELLFMDGFEN